MRHTRAFTLLELMTVLVIAGVLAFVATSSWPDHWQRARRAAAGAALVAAMAQLELHHARTGQYEEDESRSPGPMPRTAGYKIRSQRCNGTGLPLSQCVEVIAMPDRGDATCGALILRSTGEREPRNSACWP